MSYRIAGIDVHKKMLAVAGADVEVDGDFQFERHKVGTTPIELRRLADWLVEHKVEEVVMESTAQYWRPVWEALEQHARSGSNSCSASLAPWLISTSPLPARPFCTTDDFHALSRAGRPSCNQLRKSSSAASQFLRTKSGILIATVCRKSCHVKADLRELERRVEAVLDVHHRPPRKVNPYV